uniref:Uncharacterized protein n=1 Tax=Rhizophora mucronata TaxID=61149 RepID=A0A2P2R4B0_RHIMU
MLGQVKHLEKNSLRKMRWKKTEHGFKKEQKSFNKT